MMEHHQRKTTKVQLSKSRNYIFGNLVKKEKKCFEVTNRENQTGKYKRFPPPKFAQTEKNDYCKKTKQKKNVKLKCRKDMLSILSQANLNFHLKVLETTYIVF